MPSRSSSVHRLVRLAAVKPIGRRTASTGSSVLTSFTANNATYNLGAMFDSPPIPTVWERLLWGSFLDDSPED